MFLTERGLSSLDSLISACNYHDSKLLQRAIHTLKYKRIPGLAAHLADFIIFAAKHEDILDGVLAPVPLHWRRQFDRGFNQSAMLAKRTASVLDMPHEHLLRRTRDTGHQAWRSRIDRLTAMDNAFVIRKGITVPSHVVLVDDIATTGATLDACSKALKNAGATRVDALVIARG